MDHLKLTKDKLSIDLITSLVSSDSCGAISLFVGTTRNNFEGRSVVTLEYEAYESMAIKSMEKICEDIRIQWPSIENIAIYHRLGIVSVGEASIIIGISSPHREEAIKATEWCINNIKKSVTIWKKEIYKDSEAQWKENKESNCHQLRRNIDIKPLVEAPYIPPYLIQIKAMNNEVDERIANGDRHSEFTCARVDAVLHKRKDSKSHLQVNRVLNSYQHRDQKNSNYLTKFIPPNGIEERLQNAESQLSLTTPVPKSIYQRIKIIEDRLIHLESISPEYIQFWDRTILSTSQPSKKKVFSIEEIDELIADAEKTN
ncbi:hypothetical protein JTB14_016211 [Gonioctena quinquepunctata]|nr:hypothetical protein JTB14_016211 [Gonioctena quinquepunctata]